MNARLQDALDGAEAVLSPEQQDELAEIVETYVASRTGEPDFTEAEYAEMKRRFDEPFVAADPDKVRALFKKYVG